MRVQIIIIYVRSAANERNIGRVHGGRVARHVFQIIIYSKAIQKSLRGRARTPARPPLLVPCTYIRAAAPRPFSLAYRYNRYIIIFCNLAAGRRRLIIDPSPASIKVMFAFATCQPDIINPDI